jgi:hypothetical protein
MAPRTLEDMLAAVEELARQMENHEFIGGDRKEAAPLVAIQKAFEERARAEERLADRVADARSAGISWAAIGRMLGTSGEGARQRYNRTGR